MSRCHICAHIATVYDVVFVPALQQFSFGRLRLVGFSWKEAPAGGVRSVKKNMIGGRQTHGKEKEEKIMEIGTKRRREEEKEENETESAKRRCVASFSVEASGIFSQG